MWGRLSKDTQLISGRVRVWNSLSQGYFFLSKMSQVTWNRASPYSGFIVWIWCLRHRMRWRRGALLHVEHGNLLQQLFFNMLSYQRNLFIKCRQGGELILFHVFKLLVILVHEISLKQLELVIHDNLLIIFNYSFKFCISGDRDGQCKPGSSYCACKPDSIALLLPAEPQSTSRARCCASPTRVPARSAPAHQALASGPPAAALPGWICHGTAPYTCLFRTAHWVISGYLSNQSDPAAWQHSIQFLLQHWITDNILAFTNCTCTVWKR